VSDALRPEPSSFSRFWWDGLRRHELLLQRCAGCGRAQFPPLPGCRRCGSADLEVTAAAGTGVVYSWIVAHYAFDPAVADDLPYVVATVELEEGPRLYARLVGCEPGEVRAGMPVRVRYDDRGDHTVATFVAAQPVEDIPGFL
jgi:uncharacterized OB-fold protein